MTIKRFFSSNYFLAILALLLLTALNHSAVIEAINGQFYTIYPDANLRMLKVIELMKHHQWYNHVLMRTNTPWGANYHHWTRALDLLILAGAYPLTAFYSIKKAVSIWSFILPVISHFISAFIFVWAAKPLGNSLYQRWYIVLAFIVTPLVGLSYLPMRVDYNFLVISLFIALLGFWLRIIKSPQQRDALKLALIFVVGTWVSISFYIAALVAISFIIVLALLKPENYYSSIRTFFATSLALSALIILIEHGSLLSVSYDTFSLPYLLVLAAIMVALMFALRFKASPKIRLVVFALSMAALFVLLCCLFNDLYLGPYAAVDKYIRIHVFPMILELKAPLSLGPIFFFQFVFNLIACILYFSYLFIYKEYSLTELALFCLFIIFAFFELMLARWSDYAQVVFILCLVNMISLIQQKWSRFKPSCMFIFVILLAGTTRLHSWLFQPAEPRPYLQCIKSMVEFVNSDQMDKTITAPSVRFLTDPAFATFIMLYTPHQVVGGFYHPNVAGLKDSFHFIDGSREQAQAILKARGIDYLMACSIDTKFNAKAALIKASKLSLPKAYDKISLYRGGTKQQ